MLELAQSQNVTLIDITQANEINPNQNDLAVVYFDVKHFESKGRSALNLSFIYQYKVAITQTDPSELNFVYCLNRQPQIKGFHLIFAIFYKLADYSVWILLILAMIVVGSLFQPKEKILRTIY